MEDKFSSSSSSQHQQAVTVVGDENGGDGSSSNSTNELASLLIRIQQLEQEKAQVELRNGELEMENAQLKDAVSRCDEQNDAKEKKMMKKKPTTIFPLSDESLLEAMRFLERWDLDAMPMVSQKFRRVTTISAISHKNDSENDDSPQEVSHLLPQQRMIDLFVHSDGASLAGVTGPNSLFHPRLVLHRRALAPYDQGQVESMINSSDRVVLGNEALDHLIQRSQRCWPLRARRSVLLIGTSHASRFASLWDGGALEIKETQRDPFLGYYTPELIANCSSLHIQHHYYGGGQWGGAGIGDPESGVPRCPKVVFGGSCSGITFSTIVDYLFASVGDGRKRELEISGMLKEEDYRVIEKKKPATLMTLIKRRLDECAALGIDTSNNNHPPVFTLKLTLPEPDNDEQQALEKFELLPPPPPPPEAACPAAATLASHSAAAAAQGIHRCTFVAERETTRFYDGRRGIHVEVQCL